VCLAKKLAKLIPFYKESEKIPQLYNMKKASFLLLLILVASIACDNTPIPDPIPFRFVNKTIDLNNLSYQKLKFDGGYVYEEGGVRGIIIYRKNALTYYAFERNCPYRPFDDCARVEVDGSALFMLDPCCKSQFDFEGRPMGGAAFSPMLRYRTNVAGSILTISN
jgi:hypothetical protein